MDIQSIFTKHRTRNIFFASLAFLVSFVIYTLTVAPTTTFWDPAEFIAVSHTLQIAHPPGSPFFALWGRLFSMFVPTEYVALSINMISVLTSAFSVMLLYLIIVRLIQEWKGSADNMDLSDQIGLYAGGLFGALTFAVTHTQWFNAVEAEMYASSMCFTALVVWMALRWAEHHKDPYSDRWLVMIAYLIGLGIGVHLLNLLALFFVAMIIYFRKWTFNWLTFAGMGGISIAVFLLIYPFTIINIPNLADEITDLTYGLIGPLTYMILIVGIIVLGIVYSHRKKMRLVNLALMSYAMIVLGYSSFALIFIRSQAEPPIDENDPSTLEAFDSYLKREQYGEVPLLTGYSYNNQTGNIDESQEVLFPRRHSGAPQHMQYYSRFSSDLAYFLQYQVGHMYFRYFNWNFIGREADVQNAGWYSGFGDTPYSQNKANAGFFYLPLLFGLFGFMYHFRNDWKRGLSVLALFLLTGLAIIVYLNQTPDEPRERDYAYVGSFFAFAIWIGMGGTALIELAKEYLGRKKMFMYGLAGAMFISTPGWMAKENWASHDQSLTYVARDYAYNLLISLEPNAILFTNGDNDTFPLWYLQEVEGIRTDVRVVCLSLLNTDWYIKQMRDRQTHESLPLPIRWSDEQIDEIALRGYTIFEPDEMVLPVDKELLARAFASDDLTSEFPDTVMTEMLGNQIRSAHPYTVPIDSLDDEVRWQIDGRMGGYDQQNNPIHYLQTQDRVILEILSANQWLRPVYFANTVSNDSKLNLFDYFQYEGKAFRVVPKEREIIEGFGYLDTDVHTERLSQFSFREWDNPDAYFDENIRRMLVNYRYSFINLAETFLEQGDLESAVYWLSYGEEKIPFRPEEDNWIVPTYYAYDYARAGALDKALELSELVRERLTHWLQWNLERMNKIEQNFTSLQAEAESARSQADMDRFQRSSRQLEGLANDYQDIVVEMNRYTSMFTLLQNIYYRADMIQEGDQLAQEINAMVPVDIAIPENREENEQMLSESNLGL